MPRYYFDLFNDRTTIDEEGRELPNVAIAIDQGRTAVRHLAAESVETHGHLILSHRLVIRDEAGTELHTLQFGDVISVGDESGDPASSH